MGLFGPRGSSKSTLLDLLRPQLVSPPGPDCAGPNRAPSSGAIFVPKQIDCSLSPAAIPLGLSLVARLREQLTGPLSKRVPDSTEAQHGFEALREAYLAADPTFRSLARDLAVSPNHYGHWIREEIRFRFQLPQLMADWLTAEAERFKCTSFVLLLDDVDLAPRGLASTLLWSLLDELHQPRLILVLAADVDLLERSAATGLRPEQTERGLAQPTEEELRLAQSLLYKVIPEEVRFHLRRWPLARQLAFPPDAAPDPLHPLPTLGQLLGLGESPALTGTAPATETAPSYVQRFRDHLAELLPAFPRGLENLYRTLREHRTGSPTGPAGTAAPPSREEAEFLSQLAESRGEHQLSRRLPGRPPEQWARFFAWDLSALPALAWEELVRSARKERDEHSAREALWALLPSSSDLPLRETGDDAPHWAELLLDDAIRRGTLSPVQLISRFAPLRDRLADATIRFSTDLMKLSRQLQAAGDQLPAELRWVSWGEPGDTVEAEIGWLAFLRSRTGERRSWPTGLLNFLGLAQLRREAGPAEPRGAEFLPRNIRSLLLFTDALHAAPWHALSQQSRFTHTSVLVRLAVAMVWSAYAHGLNSLHAWSLEELIGTRAGAADALELVRLLGEASGLELQQWSEARLLAAFARLPAQAELRPLLAGFETKPPVPRELARAFLEFAAEPLLVSTDLGT